MNPSVVHVDTAMSTETDWSPIVTGTVDNGNYITMSLSIPLVGVEKLRKVQAFTGLQSIEDVIKFLLGMAAERVNDMGHMFDEDAR